MPQDLMEMLAPLFDQATKLQDIEGSQNLLFPKRFTKKHPRIASMVEGAVLGAALTKPSSTPGEGISNVAQAILGIPEFKKNKQMQKILAPLGMIREGLEMQKLQSETGLAQARAEKLGRPEAPDAEQKAGVKVDAMGRPVGFSYDPSEGTFTSQQIDVPEGTTFDPPGTTAGTDIERLISRRNAERVARGEDPMNTTEEATYRAELRGQGAYISAFEGGRGRERIAGPIRDRNELLKTEMGFANKEVERLEKMDEFEYMMEDLERGEGDLATALAEVRTLRSDFVSHLRMGGSLSWETFKMQRQGPVGGNPFRPNKR